MLSSSLFPKTHVLFVSFPPVQTDTHLETAWQAPLGFLGGTLCGYWQVPRVPHKACMDLLSAFLLCRATTWNSAKRLDGLHTDWGSTETFLLFIYSTCFCVSSSLSKVYFSKNNLGLTLAVKKSAIATCLLNKCWLKKHQVTYHQLCISSSMYKDVSV